MLQFLQSFVVLWMEGMERKYIPTSFVYFSSILYANVLILNEFYLVFLLLSNDVQTSVCERLRKHSMPQLIPENLSHNVPVCEVVEE